MKGIAIFGGNSNPDLAKNICDQLDVPLSDVLVSRFSEGEIRVEIKENIRGKDVFIIQPTCPPSNDNLMAFSCQRSNVSRQSVNTDLTPEQCETLWRRYTQ